MADGIRDERLPALTQPMTAMDMVTNILATQIDEKMDPLTLICTLSLLDLFSILNLLHSKSAPAHYNVPRPQPSGPDLMALMGPLLEQMSKGKGGDQNQKLSQIAMLLPLLTSQMGGDGRKPNINALLPLLKLMAQSGPPNQPQTPPEEEAPAEG